VAFFHGTLVEDDRCDNLKDVVNRKLVSLDDANGDEDEEEQVEEVFDPFYLCFVVFYFLL